ncbi:hypothetical protein F2Q69_00059627 [Brassica cretica]|uniref:Zinc finger PMZ-type domain-containing protein n=1 Tax=Brassica cretica TaxID=69181 RepID=A0A8S9RM44_BRACR|nr:hypothetical protein F2Q69_00059627 [Brassica cretica]
MSVQRIDGWRFFVQGGKKVCVVDLEPRKCDCGVCGVEKIPCSHAIAAGSYAGLRISILVCPVYSKDALFAGYSENIYPCAGQQVEAHTCFPPEVKHELGGCYVKDAKEAKIWVEVNGLKPLVMKMEIELPTEDNDVKEVEFEYIKIEKNLFTCFSLFHKEVDCPPRHPNALPPKERALGITQSIALQRIEAEKRRHDDRRGYSRPEDLRVSSRGYYGSYAQRGRNNTKDRNYHIQREDHHIEQSILSRTARSSSHHPRSKAPSLQYRVVDKSRASAGSSAPLQNPVRQYEDSANRVVRYPQAEKDLPSENTQDDRRSALERLQEPNAVDNHPVRVSPSFESGRLQLAGLDVENDDLLEEDIEEQPLEIERVPASLWLGEGVDVSSRRGTIPISNQRKMTNKRKEAKIWVEVNGLKPLVMQMEIELPTEDNDVMEVEFEYIKIEKNCFTCFSLFHEEVDCPRRHPNALPPKERALGYYGSYAQRGRNNTKDRNYHIQREDHHREQSILSRTARSSSHHPRSKAPSLQYRVVDKSRASAGSSAPLQNPVRQYEDSANRVVRYPQAEKDLPSENTQEDRRSALERLQEPNVVDNHPVRVSPSFESGRLQLAGLDVENDDLSEEDIEEQPLEIERVPASLWLGEGVDVSSRRGTIPISNQRKMTNKRKVAKTPIRKRVVRSPLLGLNQKKTSTVRA